MSADNSQPRHVAVIGAGIIGASTALWLQGHGYRVTLMDRNPPGTGTSYGNACTIATYASVPINTPAVFRQLPGLLLNRDGPLRIDWRYALTHPAWMLSFLRHCGPRSSARISAALGRLLPLAVDGIQPLIERSGAREIVSESNGFMYLYSHKENLERARKQNEIRVKYGSICREIDVDEIRERAPNLKMPVVGGFSFEDVQYLKNPQKLVEHYVARFTADGGEFLMTPVVSVHPDPGGADVVLGEGKRLRCDKLVVAAGAWSRGIAGSGAEDLPLDTERGYHVLFKDHGNLVAFPLCWAEAGFYAVPMEHGLRIAGTVEFAGLVRPANKSCTDYLTRRAHEMFGDIGTPDDRWLGFRPTFPDALPVLGQSHRSQHVYFAFGHQHIGITLSGITGKIIADLIAGKTPPVDLTPYSANRFIQ